MFIDFFLPDYIFIRKYKNQPMSLFTQLDRFLFFTLFERLSLGLVEPIR